MPLADKEMTKVTVVRIRSILNETKNNDAFDNSFVLKIKETIDLGVTLTIGQANAIRNIFDKWVPDKVV